MPLGPSSGLWEGIWFRTPWPATFADMGRLGLLLCLGFVAACASDAGISPRPLPAASRWASAGERLVLVDRERGLAIAEPGAVPPHLREQLEGALGVSGGELSPLLAGQNGHPAVVMFQAGAWRLAEAWFNGALGDDEYAQQFEMLVIRCLSLLEPVSVGAEARESVQLLPQVVPVPAVMRMHREEDGANSCEGCRGLRRGIGAGLKLTDRGFVL